MENDYALQIGYNGDQLPAWSGTKKSSGTLYRKPVKRLPTQGEMDDKLIKTQYPSTQRLVPQPVKNSQNPSTDGHDSQVELEAIQMNIIQKANEDHEIMSPSAISPLIPTDAKF